MTADRSSARRCPVLLWPALALVLFAGCAGGEERQAARDAGALLESGRNEEALQAYRAGGKRFPGAAVFPLGEGMALRSLDRDAEAEVALRRSLSLDPSEPTAHLYLGHVLAGQRRLDEAVESYHEATRLDPMDARAWKALGMTEYNRRRFREARAALEKYLAFAREAEDAMAINQLIRSLPAPEDDH